MPSLKKKFVETSRRMPALKKKQERPTSKLIWMKDTAAWAFNSGAKVLVNPAYTWTLCLPLILGEILLNIIIIHFVKYTEIDWIAYMQEVEGFINGTRDYTQLKGDTGPLVYPGGFVYIYSLLYFLTNQGANIKLAQYIFCLFYVINLGLVARIYAKTLKCPPYVFVFMCLTSYRIHSLFVLRLFNDPLAMMIFYASVNLFISRKWALGCMVYSFAIGVKMNIFLFAPALLVILLNENGILKTIENLGICFLTQVFVGLPFLIENPLGYLSKSFEFNRQFFYIWTVNWRLISEEFFLNKKFHLCLLLLQLLFLMLFGIFKWSKSIKDALSLINPTKNWQLSRPEFSTSKMVLMLFVSNFIGICFSRTLHYQFYVWYYHTLPYLLWSIKLPSSARLLILGLIEMSWNTYPSTAVSSAILHAMHLIILIGLLVSPKEELAKKKQ